MGERRFGDARILVVDDEPANVLLLERILQQAQYTNVTGTTDPREVGALVREMCPDVILLDLHMPNLDGFAVLDELSPVLESAYLPVLVLTADLTREARERALSSGARDFLTKPLDATEVQLRVHNLLETRQLYQEERVLLEQTLQGSIRALTDVLALVNPAGFSRALRARDVIGNLLTHLEEESRWEVPVAAMLSQLGAVILPADTLEKHYYGKKLTHSEATAISRTSEVASEVVKNIPRMEEVTEILTHHGRRFDGKGSPADAPKGAEIPWGARVLKVVLDLDVLETRGVPTAAAMETLRDREGWYDPEVVEALAEMREIELQRQQVLEVEIHSVRLGMILAEDVRTVTGMLLVARGQEVSLRLMERLRNAERLLEPRQKVHVIMPQAVQPEEEEEAEISG